MNNESKWIDYILIKSGVLFRRDLTFSSNFLVFYQSRSKDYRVPNIVLRSEKCWNWMDVVSKRAGKSHKNGSSKQVYYTSIHPVTKKKLPHSSQPASPRKLVYTGRRNLNRSQQKNKIAFSLTNFTRMPSIVHIVYCGAWGYGSKFRAIQNAILSQCVFFPIFQRTQFDSSSSSSFQTPGRESLRRSDSDGDWLLRSYRGWSFGAF